MPVETAVITVEDVPMAQCRLSTGEAEDSVSFSIMKTLVVRLPFIADAGFGSVLR